MHTPISWEDIIDGNQWFSAYEQIASDLQALGWMKRIAAKAAWFSSLPPEVSYEMTRMSKFLGVDKDTIFAAQVVYDEAWNLDGDIPLRGCTSVSENGAFGRNLDYGYPDNAADLVFHAEIPVGDRMCRIEGFAGLLGFLAIADDKSAVSINQAPKLRPLQRGRIPGLMWFRHQALEIMADCEDFTDSGDIWLDNPPASDLLMHYVVGKKSYLAEVHDKQLMWKRMSGKVVQTNTYQVMDAPASKWWEEDSRARAKAALSGRTLKESLKRASVEDWTIDTFIK